MNVCVCLSDTGTDLFQVWYLTLKTSGNFKKEQFMLSKASKLPQSCHRRALPTVLKNFFEHLYVIWKMKTVNIMYQKASFKILKNATYFVEHTSTYKTILGFRSSWTNPWPYPYFLPPTIYLTLWHSGIFVTCIKTFRIYFWAVIWLLFYVHHNFQLMSVSTTSQNDTNPIPVQCWSSVVGTSQYLFNTGQCFMLVSVCPHSTRWHRPNDS